MRASARGGGCPPYSRPSLGVGGRSRDQYSFWITPATLVYTAAWDITGTLGPLDDLLEIADLHRLPAPDDNSDPLWHLEGQTFDLRLRAAGYVQYLRRPPQHVPHQILTLAERGGLSFTERSFT